VVLLKVRNKGVNPITNANYVLQV